MELLITKKSSEKKIKVRAYQHGGEQRGYGRPVKAVIVWAKTGPRSLNITVHIGDERRHAIVFEVDASVLCEAAQEIQELDGLNITGAG
jgi:hypothetical protein